MMPFLGYGEVPVYPAKGQVQATFVEAADPTSSTFVHGEVVCIARLIPIDLDQPGDEAVADPTVDLWEVRIRITDTDVVELPEVPVYGSFYFQDGGKADFTDENFSTNPV